MKKFVIILSLKIPPHLKYVAEIYVLKATIKNKMDFCNNTF